MHCSGRHCCRALLWPIRVQVAVKHCVLLGSIVCSLSQLDAPSSEHMLIQVSTGSWLTSTPGANKVLLHSWHDGAHAKRHRRRRQCAYALCADLVQREIGTCARLVRIKFEGLCPVLPITPRLQHRGRHAHAFTRQGKPPGRRLLFSLQDSHFRPRGGQSVG